jgi:hypothetical protein
MLQYNFQPVKSRSVQVTSYVRFPCRRPVCFHKCGQLRSQLFYWSKCVCACAKMWHTAKTPSYQDGQCWWFLLGAPIFGQTTEGHSPEPLLPGDFSEPAERLDLDLSHALSIWRQLEVDFSPMFCFTCRCSLEISERPQIGKEHTNNPTNSPNSTSPYSHTSHYQYFLKNRRVSKPETPNRAGRGALGLARAVEQEAGLAPGAQPIPWEWGDRSRWGEDGILKMVWYCRNLGTSLKCTDMYCMMVIGCDRIQKPSVQSYLKN